MYNKIKYWYEAGLWNADKVQQAADKGIITQAEANSILNGSI